MEDPDFTMPPIEIGMTVLFYIDGDKGSEPCPGIVISKTPCHLRLISFSNIGQFRFHDGVMHIDDPKIQNMYNDSGGWDYTANHRRLEKLFERLGRLEKLFERLERAPKLMEQPAKRGPGRPRKNPEPVST